MPSTEDENFMTGSWPQRHALCRNLVILALFASIPSGFAAASPRVIVAPGSMKVDHHADIPAIPVDVADSVEEKAGTSGQGGTDGGELLIAPLPSRNGLLGWTLVLPAAYMYRPPGVSEKDPTWLTGIGAFYAENKSWGAGLFHKMNLSEDRWRITGAVAYADLRYEYFGIGGGGQGSVPLRQPSTLFLAEVLREVTSGFYLGLRGSYVLTDVRLDTEDDDFPPELIPPIPEENITLTAIAPRLLYDTRNNEFYPTEGFLLDGQVNLGLEALGSDSNYQIYKVALNHYRSVGSAGVLAFRGVVEFADGAPPFFLLPAFGSDGDLRGYQPGSHRNRFLFAAQVEYRHRLTDSIGAVVFGGVGTVASKFGEWGDTLPAGGFGLRYVVAKENNVSLRIDFAWGRGDKQFYLSLGEAF